MTNDDERRPDTPGPTRGLRARGRIEDGARRRIGRDLQALYAGVLEQPLPDRLIRLVDDLTRSTEGEGSR